MGRPRRYDEPGTIYHVTCKMQEPWFATDPERRNPAIALGGETACEMLMECIKEAKPKHEFRLYAFVIMENHYHLVIGVPMSARKGCISRILHAINSTFAHRMNTSLDRRGGVVLERTQTPVIRRPGYLAAAINYVHCNPGRCSAGVDPRSYQFSSFAAIMTAGQAGWYAELVDLEPAELDLPGFEMVSADWLRVKLARLLDRWLGGDQRDFARSICSVAVGTPTDRLAIDLSLGHRPIQRGRWAVSATED